MTHAAFAALFREADKKEGIEAGELCAWNHDFMLKVMRSGVNAQAGTAGRI